MSEFVLPAGFEDAWRPVVSPRVLAPDLSMHLSGRQVIAKSRLSRIVSRAPEVVVTLTGAPRSGKALRSHLDYVSRQGDLPLEGPEREALIGRAQIRELAADWAWGGEVDSRALDRSPIARSIVFSMSQGTDPTRLMDAVRCFAAWELGAAFDYVLVLHTDTAHPHVHATVRALGREGERLNLGKADLERWRQDFAQDLRNHGIEAEALPRRARGVILRPERRAVRGIRERYEAGQGPNARVLLAAQADALTNLGEYDRPPLPWETRILARQNQIRGQYLRAAELLGASEDPSDQRLAFDVLNFVASMPKVATRRQLLESDFVRTRIGEPPWIKPAMRERERERER
jgi:hypothetical protein